MKNLLEKLLILGITVVMIAAILCGCNLSASSGKSQQNEHLNLGCQVNSVEHGLGVKVKVCSNDNSIFYVDEYNIYKNDKEFSDIAASQKIVSDLEKCPDFVCCTNDKLVYAMSGYSLQVFDLKNNTEKTYFLNENFGYVFERNGEIIVSLSDSDAIYKIVGNEEPVSFTGDLSEYAFAQSDDKKISFKINGKEFKTDGKNYSYDGSEETCWKEILLSGEAPGINKSTVTVDGEKAYFLCQYKNEYPGRRINPRYGNLKKTALIYFDAENNKTNLVYQSKADEQIGAYSIDEKKIYILRNTGIYSINFDGTKETKLFDLEVDMENRSNRNNYSDNKVKHETEITFEQCAGRVFVYYEEYTVEHLLTVL